MSLKVHVDTGSIADIMHYCRRDDVAGATTNPSLLRTAGVTDYIGFLGEATTITTKALSAAVITDDLDEMIVQAYKLADLGQNIIVKIPVTNSLGQSTIPVIREVLDAGVPVNVTAMFTLGQMDLVAPVLQHETPSIVSVFAGRIADTGIDPKPIIHEARRMFGDTTEILWASARCVFNYYEAKRFGADIITLSPSLIDKLHLGSYDLDAFSLETVRQFHNDALEAGYAI